METLGTILVAGFAVAYVSEMVTTLFRQGSVFRHIVIFALAVAANIGFPMPILDRILMVPATAFVAATLLIAINALTSNPQIVRRR
jgi:hypothetical protein